METERQFFFVLALPRSRTAWLALALSLAGGAWCSHEAALGHDSLDGYLRELRARDAAAVGDVIGSPAYVERLLAEFPDARWIIVERPEAECRASAERETDAWNDERWQLLVTSFHAACHRVSARAVRVQFADLDDAWTLGGLVRFLGLPFNPARALEMMRLRVTQLPTLSEPVPFVPAPVELPEDGLSIDKLRALGFDLRGLSVRRFDPAHDFATVNAWWAQRIGCPILPSALPPLGVVVEDADGPAAALWCYESFGVGVAMLTHPISRPGLRLSRVSAAMAFAVAAVVSVAGKLVEPEGRYHTFLASTYPAIARLLRRLGFVDSAHERVSLHLTTA